MTNMFKKTLVAAALAGLSTSALAVEVNVPASNVYSAEGLQALVAAENNLVLGDSTITLGTEYNNNDLIRITVSGATVVSGAANPSLDPAGAGDISFLSREGNVLNFRVTDDAGLIDGETLTLSGVTVDPSSVSASGVTYSYAATVGSTDIPIDNTGTTSANVFEVASQFSISDLTQFDSRIDVAADRMSFEGGSVVDVATFTFEDDDSLLHSVGAGFAHHVLYADFSAFTDVDGEQVAPADFVVNDGDFASLTLAEDGQSLRLVQSYMPGTPVTANILLTVASSHGRISTQDFEADVNFASAADPEVAEIFSTTSSLDFGEWTLNGASAFVPYMPYGSTISQVMLVTNNSSQTGDISVTAFDEAGNDYDLGVVAQSAAGTTNNITAEINAALTAQYGFNVRPSTTQRLAFEIITNAPEGQVVVYSAYNVGGTGARLVVNDTNGRGQ